MVISITFYQERKTEKTLEALRDLSSPRVLVVRDGEQQRIAGRDAVVGDVFIIQEGDRVPAVGVILTCENLTVDESLLTGESMPVRKIEWDNKMIATRPGGDDLPFIYSGSMVTSGRALARINFTGLNTEIGKIGKSLGNIKDEDTLLHKETNRIVRIVAVIGIILCALVVVFYALVRNDIMAGFLAGITLSMAMLPEEFPVVLLIFLTLGAWRISKRKVLTRRSAAIETLGAATVLCADKTGTITLNKMQLNSLYTAGSFFELTEATTDLPEKFKDLLECGVLASKKDPFDPLEKELNKIGGLYLKHKNGPHNGFEPLREYPLSKKLLALSHVWKLDGKQELIVASKGAPEAILELCHIGSAEKQEVLNKVKEMSEKGLRVLGTAQAIFKGDALPADQHDFEFEFIGLLGFIDPIRKTVPQAVLEAQTAGIRVIMITGDYPGTAQFIAQKIGLQNPLEFLTGVDLERLSESELKERIKTINVFARVLPEQKLLIVNALKADGEIVAMTGDGVNDAPALKSAHIGVAMGQRGTDVAREASALVLLDDNFVSIVSAVKLGRRIYHNIKRAMGYILAVHVPTAGMAILPLALDLPIMLLPAHIAFLELIIDPACSTVFEAEKGDKDIMKRPPRNLQQPMLNFKNISLSLLQGLSSLVVTFILFIFALKTGRTEFETRSFVFASLVIGNLMLIIINLSWTEHILKIITSINKILFIIVLSALVCLMLILYVPFLNNVFHLAPLYFSDLLLILGAVIISLSWFEVLKFFKRKRQLRYN